MSVFAGKAAIDVVSPLTCGALVAFFRKLAEQCFGIEQHNLQDADSSVVAGSSLRSCRATEVRDTASGPGCDIGPARRSEYWLAKAAQIRIAGGWRPS